jgi:hypothetical protein
MKTGDLYRVSVPPGSHPRDDYLHGMLVVILGERYIPPNIQREYIRCLGDKVRMFPTRWLEVL